MDLVRKSLNAGDASTRAAALEAFETLGDKRIMIEVLPILDRGGMFQAGDEQLFRAERNAVALPPPTAYGNNLRLYGFICSDGGKGRDDAGMAGMAIAASEGIAGATVDGRLAKMGDGMSTYNDGIISGANSISLAAGVKVGMSTREAAKLLVSREA